MSFGAPTQWAKLRSPLGSMSTTVVLVEAVGCSISPVQSSPSASKRPRIRRAHSSRPTYVKAAAFMPSRAMATPELFTIPPVTTWSGSVGSKPAAADGHIQANRPAEDVGHARTTENTVDVFSHSGIVYPEAWKGQVFPAEFRFSS